MPGVLLRRRRSTTASGYDSGLSTDMDGKVFVHEYNGTDPASDVRRSFLRARLLPSQAFTYTTKKTAGAATVTVNGMKYRGGLSVTVLSVNATSARVRVCRCAADTCTETLRPGTRDGTCDLRVDGDCDVSLWLQIDCSCYWRLAAKQWASDLRGVLMHIKCW